MGPPREEFLRGVNRQAHLPPPSQPTRIVITDDAKARARRLLISCLNPEQRSMYENTGKFRVVSNKGNVFEIKQGRMHNVYRLDLNGNRVEEWCVLPQGELAECDVMLAQKIGLEVDEDDVRRNANITLLSTGWLIQRAPTQYIPGIRVPEIRAN